MHNENTKKKSSISHKALVNKPNVTKYDYCCKKCANPIHWRTALYGNGTCRRCNMLGDLRCEYNNDMFRSSWEANFAKWCDCSGIKWAFEPKAFDVIINEKGRTYTPDFYLPEFDLWIEVKGWFRQKAKDKFNKFKETYPEINIELFNENKLTEFSIIKY